MYTRRWFLDCEVDAGDAEDKGYDGDMRSVIKLRSLQNNSYLYLSHRSILPVISRAGWTQLAPERFRVDCDRGEHAFGSQQMYARRWFLDCWLDVLESIEVL
jgi:hypothetical protein